MAGNKTQETAQDKSRSDVAIIETKYDTADLRAIQSWEDAVRLAGETLGTDAIAAASDVIGDGFAMIEDKDQLVKTPLFLLQWTVVPGDYGTFTVVRAVTRDNRKVVVVDGSHGIHTQLMEYTNETGHTGGLFVKGGLRRSDYEYEAPDGSRSPATTYYLDTSA